MTFDFLTKNWGTKLVSLVLAVGLWYYAVGEEKVEVSRTIPVEIKLEQEKLSIVGKPTRLILVTLQAPRSMVANLASEDLKAVHRITKVDQPGEYNFRLEPREIKLPSEQIRVVRIEPEVLQVKIDEMIVQKMEVEPVFLGEPAFGYRLQQDKIQLDPASVLVEGPKAELEKMSKIKTQPIDVVERLRSFRKTVRIAEEPGLKLLSESLVDAYVPIQEVLGDKALENIPVKILGTAGSFTKISVESATVNLTLQGSPKALAAVKAEDIVVYVEISGLKEGIHEIPLKAVLPEGVFLKENPPPAKVTLERKSGVLPLV